MKIAQQAFDNKSSEFESLSTRLVETDQLVEKLRGDVSSLETKNRDMQELIVILQQRHETCQEIATETESGLKRKISDLEECLFASREKCDNNLFFVESSNKIKIRRSYGRSQRFDVPC